jgi:hypothetical protein
VFRLIESPQDRQRLLRFARETAVHALGAAKGAPPEKISIEGRFGGAFVTFWRGSTLRGCIGSFVSTRDIAAMIQDLTQSSLKDPRFTSKPIIKAELAELTIEISILSDPKPTDDPVSLVPGQHGIIIRRGGRSGCFLPKVGLERSWSAEEFLSNCCSMKAGLPSDAWREPDTEVLVFEAQVFSEGQLA